VIQIVKLLEVVLVLGTIKWKIFQTSNKFTEIVLEGKENWGHTDIEKEATEFFNQNIDEWFHNLVAYYKGPDKIFLIKDKWKLVSQT